MPRRMRGDNQQRILEFIKSEVERRGYPPSVREIGEAVGLKSTSTVHGHLTRLEKRGLLHRDAMKPRAMEVLDDASLRRPLPENAESTRLIPLVGRVTAGIPILAEECIDAQIPLPESMLSDGEHYILRVVGESMIDAGILDGDYIVVHRQVQANNGEIVVAMIEGEATVKRFFKENGRFRLQPENPDMAPIYADDVEVLGRVVSVYRIL